MLNDNSNVRHQFYWSGFAYYLSETKEVKSEKKHNPKQTTQQANTRSAPVWGLYDLLY